MVTEAAVPKRPNVVKGIDRKDLIYLVGLNPNTATQWRRIEDIPYATLMYLRAVHLAGERRGKPFTIAELIGVEESKKVGR